MPGDINIIITKKNSNIKLALRLTLIGMEVLLKCDFHIKTKVALIKSHPARVNSYGMLKYSPLSLRYSCYVECMNSICPQLCVFWRKNPKLFIGFSALFGDTFRSDMGSSPPLDHHHNQLPITGQGEREGTPLICHGLGGDECECYTQTGKRTEYL